MKNSKYIEQNRRAWNEIADIRHKMWPDAEFFRNGGSLLDRRITEISGDVCNKTLCHLQCATGEDSLSWANQGAIVTGVDISEKQIEIARRKAHDASIKVEFASSDIYRLSEATLSTEYDIVFTGGGAIVWLPDLKEWANVVYKLLRPNGRFILYEEHPIMACLDIDGGQVNVADDYFGRKPGKYRGWCHFEGGADAKESKYEFSWPLGDVLTSLSSAGLRIVLLKEWPPEPSWRFGEDTNLLRNLPGSYALVAVKN